MYGEGTQSPILMAASCISAGECVRRRWPEGCLRSLHGLCVVFALVAIVLGTGRAASADSDCGCMDMVFVVDTTASMDSALQAMASTNGLRLIVDTALDASGGDLRLGLIIFDGAAGGGEDYVRVLASLTPDIESVKTLLAGLLEEIDNGGAWAEASDEALREMLGPTSWSAGGSFCVRSAERFDVPWRAQCIKHAVLLTDNIPGGCDDRYQCEIDEVNALARARQAAAAGIGVSSIYVGGWPQPSGTLERIMLRYAVLTGGTYVPIAGNGNGTAEALQMAIGSCPDCNGNGVNDLVDLASGPSLDRDGNGVPDECQLDCNGNGLPDAFEILTNPALDANGDAYLDECEGDCNSDGLPDACAPDCDGDGIPDACELAPLGSSSDCNFNGVPDECEPDCDGDGIPDVCELPPFGNSSDCNYNGIPDECEEDCNSNGVPDDCDLRDCVGEPLPSWCADCNSNGIPDSCDVEAGAPDLNGNGIIDACEDCNTNGIPDGCDLNCEDPACVGIVGCEGSWNLKHNDIPDECEPDCNGNDVPDEMDLRMGFAYDCNGNGRPDECDLRLGYSRDCNGNHRPDECDIALGSSDDCNANGRPDECEIAGCLPWDWACRDCNANEIVDTCELAAGTSTDCNVNLRLDECDVALGYSSDCQPDGVPDECQIDQSHSGAGGTFFCQPYFMTCSDDVNYDGVPDECQDCNANSILDPCELTCGIGCDLYNCGFATEVECSSNGILDECAPDCNENGMPDACDYFPADYDRDGDHDLADFAAFQVCIGVGGTPRSAHCDGTFDLVPLEGGPGLGNDKLNAADYQAFEAFLSGPMGGPHEPCWGDNPYGSTVPPLP